MHPASPLPRWLLVAGLVLALVLAGAFALRTVSAALYWADPAHRDQTIEGWMPPRYVARSWDVPPDVVAEALGLVSGEAGRRNLEQIARDQGVPVEALIERLTLSIALWREGADD